MNQDQKKIKDNLFAEYKQKSVLFVADEEATKLLHNPIYRPILLTLREGVKTAEEIQEVLSTKEEYKTMSKSSLKTIYRHLKALTSAGLVVEAGQRKIDRSDEDKAPITQRLFSRTAKFFFLKGSEKEYFAPETIRRRADILRDIIAIAHNKPKASLDCVEKLFEKLITCESNCGSNLFENYPDELAEIVGNVPIKDLEVVLSVYSSIDLLLRKSEFEKDLKECLKIS